MALAVLIQKYSQERYVGFNEERKNRMIKIRLELAWDETW